MPMPERNVEGDYRYGYQGQEKDPETGKEAFELRLWDARIGRWLTTDPYGQYASPYLGMGNNPIARIDPDGGIDWFAIGSGIENQVNDYNFFQGVGGYNAVSDAGFTLDEFTLIGRLQDPSDQLRRAFPKGYWLSKLIDKYGYFEISFNTIKGKAFEAKLNKSVQLTLSPDKQIPYSISYNSRDDKVIEKIGVENHPRSFEMGFGAGGGGGFAIVNQPDGSTDLELSGAYNITTAETVFKAVPNKNGGPGRDLEPQSTFLGFEFNPSLGIYYGAEVNIRLGFLFD